jgi:phosphate transport system substrate-binding protein
VPVIGGLGIFMLGLEFMSNGIQNLAVSRMRALLAKIAGTPVRPALLQNRTGNFVRPDAAGFQAAAASAEWSRTSDFYLLLTNTAGGNAYPITATVFALMPRTAARGRTEAALDFFRWSLEKGPGTAVQLGYVPLPPALVKQVARYWASTFKSGS